ncbi:MAG: ABC transporter permease [Candidatus Krumholzibacteriota bacterium]|nr:ABC transporter permease [Candidatus Krumholzibacteriota bacterium]
MKGRLALGAYLAAVILATTIHRLDVLGGLLLAALLLAGRDAPRLARRALLAVLVFTGLVSLSWLAVCLWQGTSPWRTLALLNLRVFVLAFLAFLVIARVNWQRALGFSPGLTHLLVLATGQALAFRRLFEEFRQALRSRSAGRPGARALLRHGAAASAFFLQRALERSEEITQAMRSRGLFDA